MGRQTSVGNWIAAAVLVAAIAASAVYLVHKASTIGNAPPVASTPTNTPPATSVSDGAPIQHPIDQAQVTPAAASTSPLPALDGSDESVGDALARLAGGNDLSALLVRQRIIERLVATVDAVPRHEALGSLTLPARPPQGPLQVDDASGSIMFAAANSARYEPYLQVVGAVDPQALVGWYVHAYPLFQQAYQQLGYPKGYFNDRLIVVIDDLLAAPELTRPPALLRSNSYYVYADPALESLSTGQKLMMRTGPDGEARIKAKLRAIRAQLVGKRL